MFVSVGATCATIAQQVAVVLLTLQLIYAPGEAHFFFHHLISLFLCESVVSCRLRLVADNYDVCCHYFAYITRDSATMGAPVY
jgi:hypothetical protein